MFAVRDIVYAWLVGLRSEFALVLDLAIMRLEEAIIDDEQFGQIQEFYRYQMNEALGLALWLRDGTNAVETSRRAMHSNQEFLLLEKQTVTSGNMWLDAHMALCVQAGAFEDGIEAYRRYSRTGEPNFKRIFAVRNLCYALCLHHARGRFTAEELDRQGRTVLRRLLPEWLACGHPVNAAILLKIVHWHRDPSLSPLATLIKAYDDMPGVTPPDFVTRPLR